MSVLEKRYGALWRWVRVVRARPRLFLSILLGLVIVLFTPADWRLATRTLAGWDIAVGVYLLFAVRLMTGCDANHIRRRAAFQDEGRFTILVLVVASALASLVAILAELSGANRALPQLTLAGATILLSWTFMHTIFALHYAHAYYGEKAAKGGGLSFPNEETPDYWDFVYFSFVVGMTSQVSDVAVTSRPLRRLVGVHGVISFIFNVTLLALMVNIAASAI
jgi:uncharacterized membrane protein